MIASDEPWKAHSKLYTRQRKMPGKKWSGWGQTARIVLK
jgi:hypothetical protein